MQSTIPSRPVHWPSVLQLALSMIGIFITWGLAASIALAGIIQQFNPTNPGEDITSLFLYAWSGFLCGVLLLPSAGYALFNLMGKPLPVPASFKRVQDWLINPLVFILLIVIALALGQLASASGRLAWLLLPPVHLVAIGLPVWWLSLLGRGGLPQGSPQRAWGIFGLGLILGPMIILVLELLAVVALFVVAVIYLSSQPALLKELNDLSQRLTTGTLTPDQAMQLIQPLLSKPFILFLGLAFIAGIVPLIEEIFKPIGVWLLVGRPLSPAEGFTAGLLSGSGYALFENMALTTLGGGWIEAVIARMPTTLLHILTAGMMGWALSQAWSRGKYLRLIVTYLASVFVHGLWNGTAVLASIASPGVHLLPMLGGSELLGLASYSLLVLIAVLLFILLISSNRRLRRSIEQNVRSEHVADIETG